MTEPSCPGGDAPQPRALNEVARLALGAEHVQAPAALVRDAGDLDEDTHPGAVEERGLGEIDEDLARAGLEQRVQLCPDPRGGADLELPLEGDEGDRPGEREGGFQGNVGHVERSLTRSPSPDNGRV